MSRVLTVDLIREALRVLEPRLLDIEDQSAGHLHHAGRGQGGHFKIKMESALFEGKTPLQRHQMIYSALGDLMATHIHAISIEAKPPIS